MENQTESNQLSLSITTVPNCNYTGQVSNIDVYKITNLTTHFGSGNETAGVIVTTPIQSSLVLQTSDTLSLSIFSKSTNFSLGDYYFESNVKQGQNYTINVTIQLLNTTNQIYETVNFTLNATYYFDTCKITSLQTNNFTFSQLTTRVLGSQTEILFLDYPDFISKNYWSNSDGFTKCGLRTYSIVESQDYLTVNSSRYLILKPIYNKDIGIHTLTLRVSLQNYTNITYDQSITVSITGCIALSISKSNSSLFYIYDMENQTESNQLSLSITTVPNCNYTGQVSNIDVYKITNLTTHFGSGNETAGVIVTTPIQSSLVLQTSDTLSLSIFSKSTNFTLGDYYFESNVKQGQKYTINVTIQLLNTTNQIYETVNFTLNATYYFDTCKITSLLTNSFTFSQLSTSVLGNQAELLFTDYPDYISSNYWSNKDGYTKCGLRTYSIVESQDYLTVNSLRYLILKPIYNKDIGIHTLTLRVSLQNYTNITYDQSITVNITGCIALSISKSSPSLFYTYDMENQTESDQLSLSITTVPNCNYTGQVSNIDVYKITNLATHFGSGNETAGVIITTPVQSSLVLQTSDTLSLSIFSKSTNFTLGDYYLISNVKQGQNYTINVTIQLLNTTNQIYETVNFTLNATYYFDTCKITSLLTNSFTFSQLSTSVLGNQAELLFTDYPDYISSNYWSNKDGYTKCGLRTYSIVESQDYLTVNSLRQLILKPIYNKDIGIHTLTLRVSLQNYTNITYDQSITVKVTSCITLSASHTYSSINYTYNFETSILESQKNNLTLTTFPNCNHTAKVTNINVYQIRESQKLIGTGNQTAGFIISQPEYPQSNTIQLNYYSNTTDIRLGEDIFYQDAKYGENYQVQFDLTFYNTKNENQSSQSFSFGSIYIYDSCKLSSIEKSNQTFKTLVNRVFAKEIKQQFEEFTDIYSSNYWNKEKFFPNSFKCGPRTYYILEKQDYLTVDNSRILKLKSISNQDLGLHALTLVVSLQNYPDIISYQPLLVVIRPCVIERIFLLDKSQISFYKVGTGSVNVPFLNYVQAPACNYTINKTTLLYQRNLKSQKKIPEDQIEILAGSIQINVGDLGYIGEVISLYFALSFNDEAQTSDSSLIVELNFIKATFMEVKIVNQPPSFKYELLDPPEIPCILTESFSSWIYYFPDIRDPENQDFTVNFKVSTELKDIVVFNYKSNDLMFLTLSDLGTLPPPVGNYKGTFTATDYYGASKKSIINFKIGCIQDESIDSKRQIDFSGGNQTFNLHQPIPSIKKTTSQGIVVVSFSERVVLPKNFEKIQSGTLWTPEGIKQNFEVKLIPGYDQDQTKLDFTWSVQSFTEKELKLYLIFEHPELISQATTYDMIQITFWDNYLFISNETNVAVTYKNKITGKLVRQLIAQKSKSLDMNQLAQASLLALVTSFVLSFALKQILDALLGMVRSISLITHLTLISVQFPKNVLSFFSSVFQLVSFDLVQTDKFYPIIFKFNDEPYSDLFDSLGYSSQYIITNLGSVAAIILLVPILILIIGLLNKYYPFWLKIERQKIGFKIQQFIDIKKKSTFFNEIIMAINELYLVLAISALVNFNTGLFEKNATPAVIFNSIYASCALFVVLAFPIAIFLTYYIGLKKAEPDIDLEIKFIKGELDHLTRVEFDQIRKNMFTLKQMRLFKSRFGTLSSDLDIQKIGLFGTHVMIQIMLIRKLILAVSVVYLMKHPIGTIMVSIHTQLIIVMIGLQLKPYQEYYVLFRESFNEITILNVTYLFLCFTDFVSDPESKVWIGDRFIQITCFNIFVNILQTAYHGFLHPALQHLRKAYKHYYLNKERKRKNEARRIKREKRLQEITEQQRQKAHQEALDEIINRPSSNQIEKLKREKQQAEQEAQESINNINPMDSNILRKLLNEEKINKVRNQKSNLKQKNQSSANKAVRFSDSIPVQTLQQSDKQSFGILEQLKTIKPAYQSFSKTDYSINVDILDDIVIPTGYKSRFGLRPLIAKELGMQYVDRPIQEYLQNLTVQENLQRDMEKLEIKYNIQQPLHNEIPPPLTLRLAAEEVILQRAKMLNKRKVQWLNQPSGQGR